LANTTAHDLYSLGLSIWSIFLDGRNPYEDQHVAHLIYQQFGTASDYFENVGLLKLAGNDTLLDIVTMSFERHPINPHSQQMLEAVRNLCRLEPDARDICQALRSLATKGDMRTFDGKPMTPEWSSLCFSAFTVQGRQFTISSNSAETHFEIDEVLLRETSASPNWMIFHHVSPRWLL
jgi:hypothetical protein